jgi:hypothetical protein
MVSVARATVEGMTASEDIMTAIAEAVRSRDNEQLQRLWAQIGPAGDPLQRVALAHYMADLQDSGADSLTWDLRALEAADALPVPGYQPSLHLNVADGYRRVGDFDAASRHLDIARSHLGALDNDRYGQTIRSGIDHVAEALTSGSTERLLSN